MKRYSSAYPGSMFESEDGGYVDYGYVVSMIERLEDVRKTTSALYMRLSRIADILSFDELTNTGPGSAASLREVLYCARVLDECVDAETLADLSRAVAACRPAPVCKTCDGARGVVAGVEGWPKKIIPCPACQPAPKEEPNP